MATYVVLKDNPLCRQRNDFVAFAVEGLSQTFYCGQMLSSLPYSGSQPFFVHGPSFHKNT